MDNPEKKPIIGILGGIGSGKSTVASEFAKLGCKVIDADRIAHELLDRQDVREEIIASFGRAVLDSAGNIDREKLAEVVFANGGKLSALNRVVHPLVLAGAERLIEQYNHQGEVAAIVLDIPLLELEERSPNGFCTNLVHREPCSLPVTGAAHRFQLIDDLSFVFIFPGLYTANKFFPLKIRSPFTLLREDSLLNDCLSGDAGMVGAGHP